MQIAVRGSTGAVSRKRSGHMSTSSSASGKRSSVRKARACVAHGDAVAEELAHRHERGDVVAGAEDVHVGARRVRLDEDELAVRQLDDAALAELEQRQGRGVEVGLGGHVAADEPLLADALVAQPHGHRDRRVGGDRVGDLGHELRIEGVNGDGDRAAAREPDVEALVVGEPVAADAARRAVQHLGRLADHGGLDAAAGARSPAISPAPETASVAPGSRGAEPMRSITDPTAMAVPSDVHRSRMEIMSLIDRPNVLPQEDSAVYYVALAAAGFTDRGSGSTNTFRRD